MGVDCHSLRHLHDFVSHATIFCDPDTRLEAGRQALRDQTASNSAGRSSGQNLNSTGTAWVSEPVIANIERRRLR